MDEPAKEGPDGAQPCSEQERIIFGRNLKAARIKAGLNTYDVENRTNIRRSRLAQIEAGQANPTLETMTILARLVNCTLRRLLTDDTPRSR